ncbi:MAG: copper homeostasis protein CutC [Chitinophagaceae bacterium]|nr:copper homeostasis protein CutC [Chitinophagaceae bacterium]MCA6451655.1 copper homeostasis protein CutC [Chitinophagaceae bacterium]MCA6454704.1 copper homeostasis protein CutC [Chitinophagaceae bacterium]MCA6458612.1 copper homeostasis protein CutC [Chitinophagaceae bacterium]MCA6464972.1 copper homeostasis protein CutC [Chitinophagaceae bacterium]
MLLEICVFNTATAVAAEKAGADRLELCENYANGGTTPSYGYLKTVREKIQIPVFPMIRPRGGDYFHTADEIEIIRKDILLCKELGFEGVVFGLLNQDGTIDRDNTARLVEAAYPLEVTFHRAFDRCQRPLEALETIIACGCNRILTSGQEPKVTEGLALVKQLVDQADGRIIIMPGSGLNSSNVASIITTAGITEVHTSARIRVPSETQYRNDRIPEDFDIDFVDAAEIARIKAQF